MAFVIEHAYLSTPARNLNTNFVSGSTREPQECAAKKPVPNGFQPIHSPFFLPKMRQVHRESKNRQIVIPPQISNQMFEVFRKAPDESSFISHEAHFPGLLQ